MGFFMPVSYVRVLGLVDGFNLYHAIGDLHQNHLKWLDLWKICENYAPPPRLELVGVFYFSAFATWKPDSYKRHREYVRALQTVGVKTVMGKFKEKDRKCFSCDSQWKDHEEKETDVNLALYLLIEAVKDSYDRALLITGDSDLAPAVRLVKREFPNKDIRIIAPVGRNNSGDLVTAVGGQPHCRKMQLSHVKRALLPQTVSDTEGLTVATRPTEYDPP